MCLLIYASPGSTPSKKSLRTAGVNNPDGFGFALAVGNKIIHHRSMDLDDTIGLFHDLRAEYPKAHAMFHLRITTHGNTSIDNCHPFVVDDGIVLGHNGMLPIKERDGMSDTRQFAEEWLPELGIADTLDNMDNFTELEKFAAGSKLVVLSTSEQLAKPVYIINEKDGHWEHGVWYSNNSYKYEWYSRSYRYTNYSFGQTIHTPRDYSEYEAAYYDNTQPDEFDYQDVWVDDDGVVYEWDERRGWLQTGNANTDIDRYYYCPSCDANLGSDGAKVAELGYCWDCGNCVFCEKDFVSCYCSGYKPTRKASSK